MCLHDCTRRYAHVDETVQWLDAETPAAAAAAAAYAILGLLRDCEMRRADDRTKPMIAVWYRAAALMWLAATVGAAGAPMFVISPPQQYGA